jgi:acetolactate synthase-1/2/3 large subunit/sulfoacetaldehyde acetyltransferase
MPEVTGGKALVDTLREYGVTHVFGLIGSAAMEIFDALYEARDLAFIGVRDERTGVHMADGYARASGRAGIFVAGQNGPGATNLVTGLAQARAAYSPVVAVAGAVSTAHRFRDAFQEVDQEALFQPVTKKTLSVPRADRIPEMVREALRTALTPRRGPVALNAPRDMLAESLPAEPARPRGMTHAEGLPAGDPDLIELAARVLAGARRPLVIAGGGVKNGRSHKSATALAEALDAPIAMSPGHGDAIPHDHPLNAGQVGPRGNLVATGLAREADVIVALGTRLGFNTTFYSYDNINPAARIIQVEAEPTAIGRFFPVAVGIHGDAARVAAELARLVEESRPDPIKSEAAEWARAFRAKRAAFRDAREQAAEVGSDPIQPARIYKAMRAVFPRDIMVTLDAGTLCLQATDALNYYEPPCLFTPLDFGLVGFSYACGLGVKVACPERPVVSLMGDGGFGMTLGEIGTAVQNQIATVAIVLNNGCWGAEKAYQRDFFDERYVGADLANPPYDSVAELWGARGFRVERAADLEQVLADALGCGRPAVVDIKVDPNALYSFRRDSFQHRAAAQSG